MSDITAVDLGQALAQIAVDVDDRTAGGSHYIGWLCNPEAVARAALDILGARKPQPPCWPMTRGELATRLSKALQDAEIVADKIRDGASYAFAGPARPYVVVRAQMPGELAQELVDAIEQQGTDDKQRQRAAEIAMCRAYGARCDREGGPCTCPCPPEDERGTPGTADGPPLPMPADAPYPLVTEYPDLAAAATIIRELNALSGTSGAGWDHMVNVLRFTAGHFGYELHEQDT